MPFRWGPRRMNLRENERETNIGKGVKNRTWLLWPVYYSITITYPPIPMYTSTLYTTPPSLPPVYLCSAHYPFSPTTYPPPLHILDLHPYNLSPSTPCTTPPSLPPVHRPPHCLYHLSSSSPYTISPSLWPVHLLCLYNLLSFHSNQLSTFSQYTMPPTLQPVQ